MHTAKQFAELKTNKFVRYIWLLVSLTYPGCFNLQPAFPKAWGKR